MMLVYSTALACHIVRRNLIREWGLPLGVCMICAEPPQPEWRSLGPNIIEAVLNHVSGHKAGVAGIYNRAKYADEMRSALQRWSDHVEAITRNETL